MKSNFNSKIAFLLGLLFFAIQIITLPDYGINWDTINHLPRGQVYLHYFLTGNKTFNDLGPYLKYWQKPEDLKPSSELKDIKGTLRSYYENEAFDFNWLMEIDGAGHAPLSDILSSVFNKIFFSNLRLVNDIDAYRIYGVLLASILVGLVYYWVSILYGGFAGIISSLSLALYPLFFSESHFNTEKDIPETAFWSLFIYSIWNGFTKKSWKWILASGVFFGLALGTKLNIMFSVLVFGPWLVIYLGKKILDKQNLRLIMFGALAFLIGLLIFYGTWPYIWQDFITGTIRFFGFYKLLGSGYNNLDPRFLGPFNLNFYPVIWIIYTTPIIILALAFAGIIGIIKNYVYDKDRKSDIHSGTDKYSTGILFLLWLLIPILRVITPHAGIYGGVRQLMEYIPALAIISGIGAKTILDYSKSLVWKRVVVSTIAFCLVMVGYTLYKIHPNQNVFFNKIIGGLSGAKEAKIPSWGNTFGAGYRQGFKWLNENAEKDSKAVFAHELMPNAPLIWIRPDIKFYNTARSGFLKRGEYAISLTYDGTIGASYYDAYLENFLNPVYSSDVDGVSVVKVWKNDIEHTKDQYKKQSNINNIAWSRTNDGVITDLKGIYSLSHFQIIYGAAKCDESITGKVFISLDGKFWNAIAEVIPTGAIPAAGQQPSKNNLYFPFLGEKARFIKVVMDSSNSCLSSANRMWVYQLPDLQ